MSSKERNAKRRKVGKSDEGRRSVILCIQCNEEPGTIECRRAGYDEQCFTKNEGTDPGRKIKWCQSCADGVGYQCPVCSLYQCNECEKKNGQHDGRVMDILEVQELIRKGQYDKIPRSGERYEWHPECDLSLYKMKCQHCERMVCRMHDKSCYKSCEDCKRASCNECIERLGEKWSYCVECEEAFCDDADGFSGGFFDSYCASCVKKGGWECDKCDCEGRGKGKLERFSSD